MKIINNDEFVKSRIHHVLGVKFQIIDKLFSFTETRRAFVSFYETIKTGGDKLGSVVKKRRKKMRKHKHRKLLASTRHQRRKGK